MESVTAEGLKSVFKEFNSAGADLATRLSTFKEHGVHVLGSFIFGLPSDRPDTFAATTALAKQAGLTFAQFVMMTPFPGTVDFDRWEKSMNGNVPRVDGVPITRYWLIPASVRPKMFTPHETMTTEEIRERTQGVWDSFYSLREIWERSKCVPTLRGRLAFLFISKLYRQMYANTGISTRQRPAAEGDTGGALAGGAVPKVIRSEADAGTRSAGFAQGSGVDFDYVLRACHAIRPTASFGRGSACLDGRSQTPAPLGSKASIGRVGQVCDRGPSAASRELPAPIRPELLEDIVEHIDADLDAELRRRAFYVTPLRIVRT